jgi:hypothetical protein
VNCGSIGFVRLEHVVKANLPLMEYFCGRCEHVWTVADPERRSAPRPVKRRDPAKPLRS